MVTTSPMNTTIYQYSSPMFTKGKSVCNIFTLSAGRQFIYALANIMLLSLSLLCGSLNSKIKCSNRSVIILMHGSIEKNKPTATMSNNENHRKQLY